MLQCVAVCGSVSRVAAGHEQVCCNVLQFFPECCRVLQVCCSMLHCVAVCCSESLVEVWQEQANFLKRQMYSVVNLCVVN